MKKHLVVSGFFSGMTSYPVMSGIIINHCKDPYETIRYNQYSIMGKKDFFFHFFKLGLGRKANGNPHLKGVLCKRCFVVFLSWLFLGFCCFLGI